jgi:cytochrome c553
MILVTRVTGHVGRAGRLHTWPWRGASYCCYPHMPARGKFVNASRARAKVNPRRFNLTSTLNAAPDADRTMAGDPIMVIRKGGHLLMAVAARAVAAVLLGIGFSSQGKTEGQATEPTNLIAACAPCHGFEGIGKDVEIPNLAGQHDVYLSYQLRAFRSGRRKHPDMSFMARDLTDAEIDALSSYYSGLPPR